MKTAAAYIRVSDERQDEYSPDSQLRLIKDFAINNDFDLPEEYIFYDDGISAKGSNIDKRKSFNNMIAFAKDKEHPIDAILVWKFSRFARNQEQSIVFKNLLKKNNVDVISISEPVGDDIYGSLIERIIEWMDEFYLIRLSGEVKRGMTEKASRGEAMCRGAFGYTLNGKTYIQNDDAKTVQYIFNSFLAGNGYRKIATQLDSMGVRTYRGNKPDNRFVEYILQNPVYIGKIRWSPDGRKSKDRYKGDNSNVMIVDGQHEPIIDQETFDQVQTLIQERKKKYGRHQRSEQPIQFMLKGLVRCSNCNSTLVYQSTKDPAMQCHSYARGVCKVSHHLSVKRANEAVIENIEQSLNDLNFDITVKENIEIAKIDYDALIKAEQDRIKRASDAFDDGIDALDEYKRKKRMYQGRIEQLKELKNAQNESESLDIEAFADRVRDVLSIVKNPEVTQQTKNEALRSIIDHITFEKEKHNLAISYYI